MREFTGRVDVHYQFTAALGPGALTAAADVLPADERARADRFVFERDRRDFVAAHALLRRVLSAAGGTPPCEWRFDAGEFGKPALAAGQAPLSFNLAHTRGLVVCAVAAGEVDLGVDVESVREVDTLGLAERFFAPAEIAMLQRCDPADRPLRFIEIWTVKEALVKALGTGLYAPLDEFAVSFEGAGRLHVAPPPGEDPARWSFALFAPGVHDRIAVAVRGGGPWRIAACRHDGDQAIDASLPSRFSAGLP